MAIVFSYIRFSTKSQLEGSSFERQVEMGEEFVRKHGHTPANLTLHDLGVSGFRGKNRHEGALSTFLQAIERGKVQPGSILLVENLDRLSREGIDPALEVWRKILRAGVKIAVLKPYENVYSKDSLNDPQGLMLPIMYFHLAYIESKNKSERISFIHAKKRAAAAEDSTKLIDAFRPAWLDLKNGKFVENEGAKAIRFIFEQSAAGVGQKTLTGLLQERYPPIGRSGRWNPSYVSAILNDRSVLGERQPHWFDENQNRVPLGEAIPGYYPQVIDESLWFRSQAAKAKRIKQKGPNSGFVNMLTGLVTNANDGQSMHVVSTIEKGSKNVYKRLCSYGHIRKLPGSDPVSVPLPLLEQALILALHDHKFEDLNPDDSTSRLLELRQEREGLEARANALADVLADPMGGDVRALSAALQKVRARLLKLKEEEAKVKATQTDDEPVERFRTYAGLWLTLLEGEDDRELRLKIRNALPDVLSSVYVKPERTVKGVWALVQLNFHDGSYSHFWIGPGSKTGFVKAGSDRDVDLRESKNCQVSFFEDPADVKRTIPKNIPDTLSGAVDTWLRTIEPRMKWDSFKVVAPKVRHFTEFVGADFQVADLDSKLWALWIRHLKMMVAENRIAQATANVTYSRVREFVRFLAKNTKVESFEGLDVPASRAL